MAVLRTAAMTGGRCASTQSSRVLVQRVVAHMVRSLDNPVTAGGGGDDLRGAAACAGSGW
jgi:hypothetical protein